MALYGEIILHRHCSPVIISFSKIWHTTHSLHMREWYGITVVSWDLRGLSDIGWVRSLIFFLCWNYNRHPITHPWGWGMGSHWGVSCKFEVWIAALIFQKHLKETSHSSFVRPRYMRCCFWVEYWIVALICEKYSQPTSQSSLVIAR